MAYDPVRKRVVLHGGQNGPTSLFGDTWEWDGQTWKKCANPTGSYRIYPAMSYDTARQRVLLFGGAGATNELMEWDGTAWQQVVPPSGPPSIPLARYSHAMAYDSLRNKLVVHAGMNHPFMMLADLLEWDSAGWKQCTPAVVPPDGQSQHAMAFDAARGRVVMYGNHTLFNGTWEWNGNAWTGIKSTVLPPPGCCFAMVYHAGRQRVMLFGGQGTSNAFFEWDGFGWRQLKPATLPPGRGCHAMAYDAARDCLVVFGGTGFNGLFSDTWEYGFPASITLSGSARPGGRVDLHLRTMNDGGLAYQAGSSLGTGPIPIDQRTLGLSADELLRVSTSNALPWIFSGYSGVLDARGEANAAVRLPGIPALVGTRIHTAFVTLDPKAPSGIRSISNPVMITVNP